MSVRADCLLLTIMLFPLEGGAWNLNYIIISSCQGPEDFAEHPRGCFCGLFLSAVANFMTRLQLSGLAQVGLCQLNSHFGLGYKLQTALSLP